jgi:hypothetical protein
MVIATLAGQGYAVQPSNDRGVATGDILLLVDLQAEDLAGAEVAGVAILEGATPSPSPCDGSDDPSCRHHLDGTGSFTVRAGSPQAPALVGPIVDGTLVSDAGALTIRIALGGPQSVDVPLVAARVKLTGITDTQVADGVLAGGVTYETITTILIPAFFDAATFALQRDCTGATPPACGCVPGSPGATVVSLLDDSPADCALSFEEVRDDRATQSLLASDLAIDGEQLLSFGIAITAVGATFASE